MVSHKALNRGAPHSLRNAGLTVSQNWRTPLEIDQRSGRPQTTQTVAVVERLEQIIIKDRCLAVQETSEKVELVVPIDPLNINPISLKKSRTGSSHHFTKTVVVVGTVGSLVVRASDSRPEGLGSMPDATKHPPSTHGFTCRNCGGGDRGRVAIYRPFGEFRRAKSYSHLYGAQGQRQVYLLPMQR
ncbi:hypothetical protein TNCV_979481 [Trichonephila clavipes]|nr:hypothetical protein TNCV_979481 [Trichonephila clavipes]